MSCNCFGTPSKGVKEKEATPIIVGSRASELALVQTNWVIAELKKRNAKEYTVETFTTHGDRVQNVPLNQLGAKGVFTKELDVALLDERIDFAVHSLKDLPIEMPEGLVCAAHPIRENKADALVLHGKHKGHKLSTLPPGSIVGTSSIRRVATLRNRHPHLEFRDIRGNLNTRMRKLDSGDFDAIILAAAGLRRLGWEERISQLLPMETYLYAVGQGALAVVCRSADTEMCKMLADLNDERCLVELKAERKLMLELEGGCKVPIGCCSTLSEPSSETRKLSRGSGSIVALEGNNEPGSQATEVDVNWVMTLVCEVFSPSGDKSIRATASGAADEPEGLAAQIVKELRQKGVQDILALATKREFEN